VHRRCLLAVALLGCCCELLRTHEHLLLVVLLDEKSKQKYLN
jgi:hypothetical protein